MRAHIRIVAAITAALAGAAAPPAVSATPDAGEKTYLQRDFAFVVSPEIETYLASIADKLLATRAKPLPRPKIIVYSANGFNAMADANRNIMISTETLRMLESEDELAALLGHELAHVVLDHPGKKSLINKFPLGVESIGAIGTASEQLKSAAKGETATDKPTDFAKESMRAGQNASLFWSDLLAPNWSRKHEAEADRVGLDMMRAAGYDPDAFATLFQKLRDAQLKRSARMEELRQTMVARAQARKALKQSDAENAELRAATEDIKDAMSEKSINALFEGIAKIGKDYDSPEKRQQNLNEHVEKSGYEAQDKKPRSPLFKQTLQAGHGGALLTADHAALAAVAAMEAGEMQAARAAIAKLIPDAAAPAQPQAAASNKKNKKATAAKPRESAAAPLASPHLAFAVGKWLIEQQRNDQAEKLAQEWTAFSHAPAKAFLWRAAHQAGRKEYGAANATLEDGRRRLDSGAPFLPQMVTYARATPDVPRARALASECKAEEKKGKSLMGSVTDLIKGGAPSGLYAECLARLGTDAPPPEKDGGLLDPLKRGAAAIKDTKD